MDEMRIVPHIHQRTNVLGRYLDLSNILCLLFFIHIAQSQALRRCVAAEACDGGNGRLVSITILIV